jgi:hypothetical protein
MSGRWEGETPVEPRRTRTARWEPRPALPKKKLWEASPTPISRRNTMRCGVATDIGIKDPSHKDYLGKAATPSRVAGVKLCCAAGKRGGGRRYIFCERSSYSPFSGQPQSRGDSCRPLRMAAPIHRVG